MLSTKKDQVNAQAASQPQPSQSTSDQQGELPSEETAEDAGGEDLSFLQ